MKKLMMLLTLALVGMAGVGCDPIDVHNEIPSGYLNVDHLIVNLAQSDIVVGFDSYPYNKLEITIEQGTVRAIPENSPFTYSMESLFDGNTPKMSMPETILSQYKPKMKIEEVAVPEAIWKSEHWRFENGEINIIASGGSRNSNLNFVSEIFMPSFYNPIFVLVVTDELLQSLGMEL